MRRVTVLLTSVGTSTARSIAVSIRRSERLKERVKLVGIDSDKYRLALALKYISRAYLLPKAADENYIDSLNDVVSKEGVDLIIPSTDMEVLVISKFKGELKTKVFLPNYEVVKVAQDRWLSYLKLRGLMPNTLLIRNSRDIQIAFLTLGSPLWLRARRGYGNLRSFLAYTPQQAEVWVKYWEGFGEFIASEMFLGQDIGWVGIFRDSELIASASYLKVKHLVEQASFIRVPEYDGVYMSLTDERLNSIGKNVVGKLDPKPNGVYVVNFRRRFSEVGRNFMVLDVDAGRFHPHIYVHTHAGLNLPYYYLRVALEEELSDLPLRPGRPKPDLIMVRGVDSEPVVLPSQNLDKAITKVVGNARKPPQVR